MDKVDVTPTLESYKSLTPIKWFCNKVLPCVYDDTLSEYELICKCIKYLNDMIANNEGVQENVQKLYDAFVQLQDWVNANVNEEVFAEFVNNYIENSEGIKESVREVAVPVVKEEVDGYIDSITEMNVPHLAFMTPEGYVGKPGFRRIVTADLPSDYPVNELTSESATRPLSAGMGKVLDESKAPSGYGLGGYGKLINSTNNLNTLTGSGFYRWGDDIPANAPFTYGVMLQIDRGIGSVLQKVWQLGTGSATQISAERVVNDNVGEWEWVNPPMLLGVEYRTTERWNGKPVYIKLLNYGVLPSSGGVSVRLEGENINVIDFNGIVYNDTEVNPLPTYFQSDGVVAYCYSIKRDGGVLVYINTLRDMSTYLALILVKYTKN